MAGGVWTNQNKVRPGAYINFKGIKSDLGTTGLRGTVALALDLPFGPQEEFVTLTAEMLTNGRSEALVGLKATDSASKVIKLALQNAQKLLLYRLNKAGLKATETVGGLVATARYEGTAGNFISVAIKELDNGVYQVITYFKNTQKDVQNIKAKADIKNNDFVNFTSGVGSLEETVATLLKGGVDGAVSETQYSDYLRAVSTQNFNAISSYGIEDQDKIVELVTRMREEFGIKVQGVVSTTDNAINYEGIIQTYGQGYKTPEYTVDEEEFLVWLAGATAGAGAVESNTYKVVQNAIEITNPVTDDEIVELLENGYLLLTRRRNNDIVIEKDINTLITFGDDKNESFQKNRVVRIMDDISNYASQEFETNFIGKINNDATGRDLFKASIIQYINSLSNLGAVQNFNSGTDIEVSAGEQPDGMFLYLAIQPIDALEKLYMTVEVR